jgi:hypothetical protein
VHIIHVCASQPGPLRALLGAMTASREPILGHLPPPWLGYTAKKPSRTLFVTPPRHRSILNEHFRETGPS